MLLDVAELTSVQIVQGDHIGTPIGEQPINEVTPDEPGPTGHNSFCRVFAHVPQYPRARRRSRVSRLLRTR